MQVCNGGKEIRVVFVNYTMLLVLLIDLHTSILRSFLGNEDLLEIAFTIWTAVDPDSGADDSQFFMNCAIQGGDPMLRLLRKIIGLPELRDALVAYVEDRDIEVFGGATAVRALQVRRDPAYNSFPPAIVSYARDLIHFLAATLESPSRRLRASLMKAHYLTEFGLLLNDVSLALEKPGSKPTHMKELVTTACSLVHIVNRESSRVGRNWASLIAGGFEVTLARITASLTSSSDDALFRSLATSVLMAMGTYTTYPAVLAALLQGGDKEQFMKAAIKVPEVGAHWETFWMGLS
jgi:hypothetical protein